MEHHHATGLGQHRLQRRMQVGRPLPSLPGEEERGHHVGLHRTGPEEGDVDDDVGEVDRAELAQQLALPR